MRSRERGLVSRRDALRALAASFTAALPACGRSSPDDGRTEASLWFCYGGTNREVLLDLVRKFHEVQTRWRIVPVYQGDYFEGLAKLRTAISAKAAPTLTHVVGEVIPYLAEAGVLEPLSSFEGADSLDLVPELSQAKGFTGGDQHPLIALPFNRSTPIAYYNEAMLAERGVTPPTTWAELRAAARTLTSRSDGVVTRWGFECPIDWWFWAALVGQAGGAIIEEDGAVSLGGEAGVRALEFWQTLVYEDVTMKPPPGRDYNAWQATNGDFLAGRAAMIWTSTAFLRYLEKNASFRVRAAPLPRDVRASVPTGGTMFVMPRGAPRSAQEAGFAFLRWMMQPEQANAWATRTGYMPVSRGGLAALERAGYYAEHPNDRVAIDQLAYASSWPWAKELFRIQREIVQPRLEEAVLARTNARTTLDAARRSALLP